jgi:hypothetical protein
VPTRKLATMPATVHVGAATTAAAAGGGVSGGAHAGWEERKVGRRVGTRDGGGAHGGACVGASGYDSTHGALTGGGGDSVEAGGWSSYQVILALMSGVLVDVLVALFLRVQVSLSSGVNGSASCATSCVCVNCAPTSWESCARGMARVAGYR